MQFLKYLFLVVVTVLAVLFGIANWIPVELKLGDIIVEVKLPLLILGAFLLGFLPTLLIYGARIWSLRRRLETQGGPASNAPPPIRNAPAPSETTPRTNA